MTQPKKVTKVTATICQVNAALKPLLVPLADLTLDPLNARQHPERSIKAIQASLKSYGQQKPVVVKQGTVIAGNGTVMAARALGWTHIAAVEYDRDDLSAIGFRLADNRSADLSTFDEGVVKEQLQYLEDKNADVDLEAFWTKEEQANLHAPDGELEVEENESDASMLEKLSVTIGEPKTKLAHGDVQQLGPHTLIVADPVNDAALWLPLMKPEFLFAPFPGTYVALSLAAKERTVLLVQPDPYIAGHIVDRWKEMQKK